MGSLQELKERASELFQLNCFDASHDIHVFVDDDGTEIEDDEYLRGLKEKTKLMVTTSRSWPGIVEGTFSCLGYMSLKRTCFRAL